MSFFPGGGDGVDTAITDTSDETNNRVDVGFRCLYPVRTGLDYGNNGAISGVGSFEHYYLEAQ